MYIVRSAILCENGEVVPMSKLYNVLMGLNSMRGISGFMDEHGNFHDRIEAKKIAVLAGQVIEDGELELYAEDLWPEPITI